MKYLTALFLLVATTALPSAAGQESFSLHGIVRDSMGLPIAGVEVVLAGRTDVTTVMTPDNGMYRFQVADADTYQLRATKNGFREWTRNVTLEGGAPVAMDIDLHPGYAETFIVTAYGPAVADRGPSVGDRS